MQSDSQYGDVIVMVKNTQTYSSTVEMSLDVMFLSPNSLFLGTDPSLFSFLFVCLMPLTHLV